MDVVFNPKDPNTFATASLDRTIKVWSLGSTTANYTLNGHEKGVNSIAYYAGADRPYLISGADDHTVRVWDYQNKACVRILDGHTMNVSSILCHPELPLILSGSEDCTVKVWSVNTLRLEASYSMSLERVWALSHSGIPGSSEIAIGCDDGLIVLQFGKGEPAASMDINGKVIWAKHHEIITSNIRATPEAIETAVDGEKILVASKELGHCELFPQLLQHSPNGRFVAVCGDGEYIIYTAVAWRNRAFGKGLGFAWSTSSNEYAVKDSSNRVVLFNNFADSGSVKTVASCETIYGGLLLGIACNGAQLCFYDWLSGTLLRRIDVEASAIYWSEPIGDTYRVAICTTDQVFILEYKPAIVEVYLSQGIPIGEDGIDEAFELVDEIPEKVVSGHWVGACFVYVNGNNRLAYYIGGQSNQLAIHERPLFLLGFLSPENRLILTDKDANLITVALSLSVIEYESAILRGDISTAKSLEPSIPSDQRNRVARFLESQSMSEAALNLATDPEYRFELALSLQKLDLAFELANSSSISSEHKWRLLGDKALAAWKFATAEKCFWKGRDLTSLLLLYSASGNQDGLIRLAAAAVEDGSTNIAFTCYFAAGKVQECYSLLIKSDEFADAAVFARSHLPSRTDEAARLWKQKLAQQSMTSPCAHIESQAAKYLSLPSENPQAFIMTTDRASSPVLLQHKETMTSSEAAPPIEIPVVPTFTGEMRSRTVSFDRSLEDIGLGATAVPSSCGGTSATPSIPDALSDHMSLEVNTTGTSSLRATDDFDELTSMKTFGTTTQLDIDRLSIHDELPEEMEYAACNVFNPEPTSALPIEIPESEARPSNAPELNDLPESTNIPEDITDTHVNLIDAEPAPTKSPLQNISIDKGDNDWL